MVTEPNRLQLAYVTSQLIHRLWSGPPPVYRIARELHRHHARRPATDPCHAGGSSNPSSRHSTMHAIDCTYEILQHIETRLGKIRGLTDEELTCLEGQIDLVRDTARVLESIVRLT